MIFFILSGIDIQKIPIRRNGGLGASESIELRVWDFAGQEDYYATHQCFLSQRSLYLLIWDVNERNTQSLIPWLNNLAARVPRSYLIIVGTKLDLVQCGNLGDFEAEIKDEINELIESRSSYRNINFAGLVLVSSLPTFPDYSKRKFYLYHSTNEDNIMLIFALALKE